MKCVANGCRKRMSDGKNAGWFTLQPRWSAAFVVCPEHADTAHHIARLTGWETWVDWGAAGSSLVSASPPDEEELCLT